MVLSKGQWAALAGAAVGTIALDQVSKRIATQALMGRPMQSFLGDTFRLDYARNPGAFLSLGANLPPAVRFWGLTVGVGILMAVLLYGALTSPRLPFLQRLAYLLMVAGGVSNGWDRLTQEGKVTDFLNLGLGPLRTGIFNVADLGVVAGVVLVLLSPKAAPPPSQGSPSTSSSAPPAAPGPRPVDRSGS